MSDTVSEMSDLFDNLSVCRSLVKEALDPLVQIRLQTIGFDIVGECDLQGQRISDLLNQSISDYVPCRTAQLYRDGQLIDELDELKIRKPEIIFASILGKQHEAKGKQIGSRRKLESYDAVVAIDRWLIKGRLLLTCKKTVEEFLHAKREFFPIAGAEVIDAENPAEPQTMPVAIVNRSRVACMQITEREEVDLNMESVNLSDLLVCDDND